MEHQLTQAQSQPVSPFSTIDMAISVNGSTHLDQETIRSSLAPSAEDLEGLVPNTRLSGAYGHPSLFGKPVDLQRDNVTSIQQAHLQGSPPLLIPAEPREQLLGEFFIWQNTWPPLVHEPFLRKDLYENGAKYCTPSVLSAILSLSAQYADENLLQVLNLQIQTLVQHAKNAVVDQLERPSLSVVMTAALLSLRELIIDNIPSAAQYISMSTRRPW